MTSHDHASRVEVVRDYLRDPANRVTRSDPMSRHQQSLGSIWSQSLSASHGDVAEALLVAVDAVNSGKHHGESEAEYVRRLDGVPSSAFGVNEPNFGVDKPQHFFMSALVAFVAGVGAMEYDWISERWSSPSPAHGQAAAMAAGRLYEFKDLVQGAPSGYNRGDIVADDYGARLGAALCGGVTDPSQPPRNAATPTFSDFLPRPIDGSTGVPSPGADTGSSMLEPPAYDPGPGMSDESGGMSIQPENVMAPSQVGPDFSDVGTGLSDESGAMSVQLENDAIPAHDGPAFMDDGPDVGTGLSDESGGMSVQPENVIAPSQVGPDFSDDGPGQSFDDGPDFTDSTGSATFDDGPEFADSPPGATFDHGPDVGAGMSDDLGGMSVQPDASDAAAREYAAQEARRAESEAREQARQAAEDAARDQAYQVHDTDFG